MFELNDAITVWRRQLASRRDITHDDLDEFEDHLREEIADLQQGGLDSEEAFLIATRRLGDAEALTGAFPTSDPVRRRGLRLRWLALGAVVMMALFAFMLLISRFTLGIPPLPHVEPPVLTTPRFIHTAFQFLILAVGTLLVWRFLAGDRAARKIQAMGVSSVAGIVAAVAIGGASLLLVISYLLGRGPTTITAYMPGGNANPVLMHLQFWLPVLVLLILPIFLLVVVWRMTRKRK